MCERAALFPVCTQSLCKRERSQRAWVNDGYSPIYESHSKTDEPPPNNPRLFG